MVKKRNLNGKQVPRLCQKCLYRIEDNEPLKEEIEKTMKAAEEATLLSWETAGRALEDENGGLCPVKCFRKLPDDWCSKNDCEKTGDKASPYFRCWARWLAHQLTDGKFTKYELEKRIQGYSYELQPNWAALGRWIIKIGHKIMGIGSKKVKQ